MKLFWFFFQRRFDLFLLFVKVDEKFVERLPIVSHNETSLYSAQARLNLTLTKEHFTEVL